MSMWNQEVVPSPKEELETKEEKTQQARFYKPATDIVETKEELILYLDLPGVAKKDVEIKLEKNLLKIEGRIDQNRYQNLQAQYAEYNIGHFSRSFQLSNEIDQDRIKAQIEDGVLTLALPKAEEAKPRMIAIT